jgi:exonuclease III
VIVNTVNSKQLVGSQVLLTSINVGGISSKFRYKVLSAYIQKFHIAFFSETRLQRIPQGEFPDFDIFSFKQKTRMHGLSILLKKDFFAYKKTLKGKSKCVLWLLLGSSEYKLLFIIGSVYIPGYNSKFADQNDFDVISEDIISFRDTYNCPFLLMGDYNSRTGDRDDSIDFSVVNTRRNCDKKVDLYGRNLIKMCKELDLRIVNGSYDSDSKIGNFTCHKPKGKSCVDYCIIITMFTFFYF